MTKRTYGQDCALALGLDVIGERWTLLLIRGLLTGPKRYSELLDQLQGMGTNLLAARLKELVARGIVTKRDDGYTLADRGEALRPIVHALIRWGHQFRDNAPPGAISRPEWDMLALEAAFRPERAGGIDATIELTLSGYCFHVVIGESSARCYAGEAPHADARATTTSETLLAIGSGSTSIRQAVAGGNLEVTGSKQTFRQLFRLFEFPAD